MEREARELEQEACKLEREGGIALATISCQPEELTALALVDGLSTSLARASQ